jgi:hypothetical protein
VDYWWSSSEQSLSAENIITFDFQRLALFRENAEHYVREHIVSMYPLLPTMQGADHMLLKRAMDLLNLLTEIDKSSKIGK